MIEFVTEYPKAKDFIKRFLDKNYKVPKYIFGTNHDAIEIASQVEINGFIDDLKKDLEFAGKPVIKSKDLPKNALVVIVALMRPVTLHQKLKKLEVEHIHSIALLRFSDLKLSEPWFWNGFREDFTENISFYESFDERLNDQNSVEIYTNLINFRLTGNLENLTSFSDRQNQQYFEPFLNLQSGETFVDVGGFDGQTAKEFVKRCPEYADIHMFEPEKDNLKIAQIICKEIKNIYFHQVGLSNKKQILGIVSGDSTSKVVAQGQGDYDIELNTLDHQMNNQNISFLKMDIEGAEQSALLGAKKVIQEQRPKLAICVYHQGNDFRVIYEMVTNYYPDYEVYIRHYTEGIVETVMFFIPKLEN